MLSKMESQERKLRMVINKFESYCSQYMEMTKEEIRSISTLTDQELLMIEEGEEASQN